MKNWSKKVLALVLAMAMVMGLGLTSFAAEGVTKVDKLPFDTTITAQGGSFNYEVGPYENPDTGEKFDVYAAKGTFNADTNLSAVTLTFSSATASSVTVNGSQVLFADGTATLENIDLDEKTVRVILSDGTREEKCDINAFHQSALINAKVTIEYENARTFAALAVDSEYGDSGYVDEITAEQKAAAQAAVESLDVKLPTVASRTMTLDDLNAGTDNAMTVLQKMAQSKNLELDGTSSYVQSIEKLSADSTGTCFGSPTGGWMYSVKRDGVIIWPDVTADLWEIQDGDEIIWRYTCDWGADLGQDIWDM